MRLLTTLFMAGFVGLAVVGCSAADSSVGSAESNVDAPDYQDVNLEAGGLVLYEAQVRTANACRPDTGSQAQRDACKAKVAPPPIYRAEGMSCPIRDDLAKVKAGTLDDMIEDTADVRRALTVRYVKEKVGANTLWLMPLFPNNDQWNLPDGCDNLGSPYAVRDYFHASGLLSRACIQKGRDEYSSEPCWANTELERLIADAHKRGVRVMLDVAFNHFGHNYLSYDYADVGVDGDRIAKNDLDALWNFDATFDNSLLHPQILDSVAGLDALTQRSNKDRDLRAQLKNKCPSLAGDALVRSFTAYRLALPQERDKFACQGFLENQTPGFYLGKNNVLPSEGAGDNFTNQWSDVKFLYHHEERKEFAWQFARNREYFFRVLNYWVSRGVDAFRFDHALDFYGGSGSNEWKYLLTKLRYYAQKRGQARPVFLAEEFGDQEQMNKVVDILTEGYVGDMTARGGVTKDTKHVENVLEKMNRFHGRVFTMTALETHDEPRLLNDTGLDAWTGAGFWGIGAATRSTPMILMGQELAAHYNVSFKRSDILRSRFLATDDGMPDAEALTAYYGTLIRARLDPKNRALLAPNHYYMRPRGGRVDDRIFAMAKWSDDANVMLVFHNLWEQDVSQTYAIDDALANQIHFDSGRRYRFVDALSGKAFGSCRTGGEIRGEGLFIALDRATRAQWLRLESCN